MFSFRPMFAALLFLATLVSASWLFARVYHDCGGWAFMRGTEFFWLLGMCHNGRIVM